MNAFERERERSLELLLSINSFRLTHPPNPKGCKQLKLGLSFKKINWVSRESQVLKNIHPRSERPNFNNHIILHLWHFHWVIKLPLCHPYFPVLKKKKIIIYFSTSLFHLFMSPLSSLMKPFNLLSEWLITSNNSFRCSPQSDKTS
jgi:hypothetical protein